jgi:H+-transporting ATPase
MEFTGMTTDAAKAYQRAHGYNEITEKKESFAMKAVKRLVSPISLMLFAAAALSLVGGKAFDAGFILFLLVMNVGVTLLQERKADTAIEALNAHLSSEVKTLRDGSWQMLGARYLVPDDVISLSAGHVVPADAHLVTANRVTANEAALTGESLPKEKKVGDPLYSGSFVASGLATARVSAVGGATSFARTLAKADAAPKKSALERDILRISRFLSILSIIAVFVMTAALVLGHAPWLDVLRLDLSLVIAGIPISLPTVMTLIIAYGVMALAKKDVVVRRLSSLEELANTDLLLTDKTGTLTKNRIVVNEVKAYDGCDEAEVRSLAARIASEDPDDTINRALIESAAPRAGKTLDYLPADSTRKRSTLVLEDERGVRTLSLGAPQMIADLADLKDGARSDFESLVSAFALRGYRTLALAVADGKEEKHMTLAGLLALSDELRDDAADVVKFLEQNGIGVVMVTGDNRAIAAEIAGKLAIPGTRVTTRSELASEGWDAVTADTFKDTRAFAEILPEDKYELVTRAKRFYTVASNGDGVNDLPAVKAASIGFAVSNAVDALKGAADIVLLSSGIGVMKDAFIEGRKIFERLDSYSLYRISESFRLIVTIVILGLVTGTYPLTPLQLILIALLNDIPIISLATDRVRIATRPAKIQVRRQFAQSLSYGAIGIVNSILLYVFATVYLHLPLPVVETLFFLKLTVSGHLLIYVAHTKERWWKYLPSRGVIIATALTQALATALAVTGFLMPAAVSWKLALLVWVWSFFFMQASEAVKRSRGTVAK